MGADAECKWAGCVPAAAAESAGAPKAITATAHKHARIVYALVQYGGEYVKRSEAEYTEQVRGRLNRQLKRRAKELGYEVVKTADPPAATDNPVSVAPPAGE